MPELESPPVVGSGRSSEDGLANAEGLMISNFPQSAWNEPPRVSWRPFRLGEDRTAPLEVQIPRGVVQRKVRNRAVWSLLARVLSLGKNAKRYTQGYQSKGQASEEQLCTSFLRAGREKGTSSFHLLSLEKYEPLFAWQNPPRHRQSKKRAGFLVPLFSNGNEPAGPLFSFRFLPFFATRMQLILPPSPWRQAMGHAQGQRADGRRRR